MLCLLCQVINDDYNDFVSLSTKLVNVDGALARMQAPLLELQVGAAVGGWVGGWVLWHHALLGAGIMLRCLMLLLPGVAAPLGAAPSDVQPEQRLPLAGGMPCGLPGHL